MNKVSIAGMSALAALLSVGAVSAGADIKVQVNGDPVSFQGTGPREVNGRVMVPLRGVLEKMGANVDWVQSSQTVVATKGNLDLELPIGSRTAKVNGKNVSLDVPAMTIGGSTMVPLRFVGEALGADVSWQSSSQTVQIAMEDPSTGRTYAYRTPRNTDNNNNNPAPRRFSRRMTIASGTVIPVRLDDDLSSNESRVGDKFSVTVENGRDNAGLPDGTKIEGVVREAIPSRGGKPGVLDVDFNRVILPNGEARAIAASLSTMDNKGTTRDSDGRLIAKTSSGNDRLKWVGIGAGAGLLVSTLTKGNTLLETLIGGGAGYLYNELQHKGAGNVNVKSGSELGVRVDRQFAFDAGQVDNGNGRIYRDRNNP
jgi:hypothetical protein